MPGDRGACQAGTFADACQFGAACVCVARRGCPGRKAELEKKMATRSGMCPVSAASMKETGLFLVIQTCHAFLLFGVEAGVIFQYPLCDTRILTCKTHLPFLRCPISASCWSISGAVLLWANPWSVCHMASLVVPSWDA